MVIKSSNNETMQDQVFIDNVSSFWFDIINHSSVCDCEISRDTHCCVGKLGFR